MKKIIVKESQLINITENVIREQFSDDPNSFSTQVDDVDFRDFKVISQNIETEI